jgi:hypothetical protein
MAEVAEGPTFIELPELDETSEYPVLSAINVARLGMDYRLAGIVSIRPELYARAEAEVRKWMKELGDGGPPVCDKKWADKLNRSNFVFRGVITYA